MKTFKCWAWNRAVKSAVVMIEAVNAYEAQKKAARKLGAKRPFVCVREMPLAERKDLFVAI